MLRVSKYCTYLEIWITFVIPTLKKNEYAEKKVGNWHSTFNNNAPKLHTTEEKFMRGQQTKLIQAVPILEFYEYYSNNLTFRIRFVKKHEIAIL